MITDTELEQARREAALEYRNASVRLTAAQHAMDAARGSLNIQTLATNLAGWRWGRVVNALHGAPPGRGGANPGSLKKEIMIAYCEELGLSGAIYETSVISGAGLVSMFRRMAAMIRDEEHVRELTGEFGNYSNISKHLATGQSAEQIKSENRARTSRAYGRYAPPQQWSSYLVQQGLSNKEVSAAMRVSLEAIGPEESFKIWDRAGRPVA